VRFASGRSKLFTSPAAIRRRALLNLEIGKQVLKSGSIWVLDIPAEDTKTNQPQEYPLSERLSARIDIYLDRVRASLMGAVEHAGFWPSSEGNPMCANTCLQRFTVRTRAAFGFPVSPHRLRHAPATLWAEHDPKNVRGAKDLLGHTSFAMTEKFYIVAQSRTAGVALQQAIRQHAAAC
jgi:integrase